MPWYNALGFGRSKMAPSVRNETFAAQPVRTGERGPEQKFLPSTIGWQEEAWAYYERLGEFNYAVTWKSAMLSRVRLRAAKLVPGQDEPEVVDSGPAADIMSRLAGGVPGQARMMKTLSVQMEVPGEGFLVGEVVKGVEHWQVRSIDEVRVQRGQYEVMSDSVPADEWRPLAPDHLVVRVWRSDERYYYRATSPARAARDTMRELELANRHITAQYLSRLASAGIVVFPDEITFPVREEFEDAVDPFMSEWIEIAAQAIKEPGTASAVIPIPIRVPAEFVDKIQHVDFTLKIDEKIIEKREAAIKRLATQVNIPAEVLLGMGDVNHWGAWQIEESALKTAIAPDAELICDQLTLGYLRPRLIAGGMSPEEAAEWVTWYDMSELAIRPDRSDDAIQAYDRLEISGQALRRELGFDESDAPTDEELRDQALKVIIHTLPSGAASALAQLIGEDVPPVVPVKAATPEEAEAIQSGQELPPPEENSPPPVPTDGNPEPDMTARRMRLSRQRDALHAVRIGRDGWELLHPQECSGHTYSCPHTHATWNLSSTARPGTTGIYELRMTPFGVPTLGPASPHIRADLMLSGGRHG